ncbi:hypothetical protein [Laspinema palackyanum]
MPPKRAIATSFRNGITQAIAFFSLTPKGFVVTTGGWNPRVATS